ncbi:MAG: hypothetical protein ACRC0Y_06425 [Fusobacteriaceae bacterium]
MHSILRAKIDKLTVEKNLSKLKEVLYESLLNSKSPIILELLSLVEGALGNFENSLKLLNKIDNKTESAEKYKKFILEKIKTEYLPKYNELIDRITSQKDIDDLFNELEELSPNVNLYEIVSLYSIEKGEILKSKEYLQKGLEIDAYNKNLLRIKNHILEKEKFIVPKKSKKNLLFLFLALLGISFGIYEKQKVQSLSGDNSKSATRFIMKSYDMLKVA